MNVATDHGDFECQTEQDFPDLSNNSYETPLL